MDSGFSTITTAFKLAEFCLALKDAESDNLVFLKLISRVRKDLDEACRERQEKEVALKSILPRKVEWIDDAILDIRDALNDIGIFIERQRIDVTEGRSVTLKHRFEWVLQNHQKFVSRQLHLATCHRTLLAAITTMESVPACSTSSHLLAPEPGYTKMLPSPSQRRPRKKHDEIISECTVCTVASSSDEEGTFSASPIPPSISPSPVEAGRGFESSQNDVQDAPFNPSQPMPHAQQSPRSYSELCLPKIQPMSISWNELLSSGEHDEVEALAAVAVDVLDAQERKHPAVSEMVDTLRCTATLRRNRRATAMFHSAMEGVSFI